MRFNSIKKALKTTLEQKLSPENVCFFFSILLNDNVENKTLLPCVLSRIERWFCLVLEEKKHLNLPLSTIKSICYNSNLKVSSELEVMSFLESWIKYDEMERSKFAKELIKTIRLPLLTTAALNQILYGENSFSKYAECKKFIKFIICVVKERVYWEDSVDFYNRNCNLGSSYMLYPSYTETKQEKYLYEMYNLEEANKANSIGLVKTDEVAKAALYSYGTIHILDSKSVKSYSVSTRKWSTLYRFSTPSHSYTACMFMGNIYILAVRGKTCIVINPKTKKLKKIPELNEERALASSSVFKGRIIVSGGRKQFIRHRSVEAYDPSTNKWSLIDSMKAPRCLHASISVRNKMFVVGGDGWGCEWFSSFSELFFDANFLSFGPAEELGSTQYAKLGVKSGSKVVVFRGGGVKAYVLDLEEEEWGEEFELDFLHQKRDKDCNIVVATY